MKHQIYPDRFNDDGEFVPAVVVEVPDILYLQVVDLDDCEDWPAPSEPDERTFCYERINESDVAYVPLARAERAEAERDEYRLQRDLWREGYGDIEAQGGIAALRAELDAARAKLAALKAAQEWRPEVHVMTGSTSAGRRQRDAGKE